MLHTWRGACKLFKRTCMPSFSQCHWNWICASTCGPRTRGTEATRTHHLRLVIAVDAPAGSGARSARRCGRPPALRRGSGDGDGAWSARVRTRTLPHLGDPQVKVAVEDREPGVVGRGVELHHVDAGEVELEVAHQGQVERLGHVWDLRQEQDEARWGQAGPCEGWRRAA